MSTDGSILPDDVEQLKAMIAARDAVIARREAVLLQRDIEIVGHRAVIAQKEMVITSLHDVVEQQQAKLERVHEQLARLLRERYGPRKERVDPNQLTLFTPEELAELIRELKRISRIRFRPTMVRCPRTSRWGRQAQGAWPTSHPA
ncbi:transposase [Schlesneria sp. DSM 10557]|uniref:transposase n=1 Tax=Schlesneria sp. DSM 10557 TaxID=3044399 RepID=UPI00359FCB02